MSQFDEYARGNSPEEKQLINSENKELIINITDDAIHVVIYTDFLDCVGHVISISELISDHSQLL